MRASCSALAASDAVVMGKSSRTARTGDGTCVGPWLLDALRSAAWRTRTRHGQQVGVEAIDVVKHIGGRETKPARRWLLRRVHTTAAGRRGAGQQPETAPPAWRRRGARRSARAAPAHVRIHDLGIALKRHPLLAHVAQTTGGEGTKVKKKRSSGAHARLHSEPSPLTRGGGVAAAAPARLCRQSALRAS